MREAGGKEERAESLTSITGTNPSDAGIDRYG